MAYDDVDPETTIPTELESKNTTVSTSSSIGNSSSVIDDVSGSTRATTNIQNNATTSTGSSRTTTTIKSSNDDTTTTMFNHGNVTTELCSSSSSSSSKKRRRMMDDTVHLSKNETTTTHDISTRTMVSRLSATTATSNSNSSRSSSMIVFSPALCHDIVAARIAPVYIGIQQIRPETKNQSSITTTATTAAVSTTVGGDVGDKRMKQIEAPIVYKIYHSDGSERRMTAQEKKLAKMQHKTFVKQQQQQQQQMDQLNDTTEATIMNHQDRSQQHPPANYHHDDDRYVPLTIPDVTPLETDDRMNDRDGIPPVMLSPPLARQIVSIAKRSIIIGGDGGTDRETTRPILQFGTELSVLWAQSLLRHSILPAQQVRQQEINIRTMPYHIVPEVWTRLRPTFHNNHRDRIRHSDDTHDIQGDDGNDTTDHRYHQDWLWCGSMNPIASQRTVDDDDDDIAENRHAIIEFLHNFTTNPQLHLSCGAKFGCDYLLYDGPRHERHAFAGIRILPPQPSPRCASPPVTKINTRQGTTTSSAWQQSSDTAAGNTNTNDTRFPIHPNAYDLAGYVRCLNTAGKLALLATTIAVSDDDNDTGSATTTSHVSLQKKRRIVLILDLALEKIATTTSRRPKKTIEQRLKNLAKPTTK